MSISCEISMGIEKFIDGLAHLRTILKEMEKVEITKRLLSLSI